MNSQQLDEACSSVSSESSIFTDRREEAVNAIKHFLASRGTVLSDSKLLWLAADFESDIFQKSQGTPNLYELHLSQKLKEIEGHAHPGTADVTRSQLSGVPLDGCPGLAIETSRRPFLEVSDRNDAAKEKPAQAHVSEPQPDFADSPTTVLPDCPCSHPGPGISGDTWKQIQALRNLYFVPLQACFVALVSALHEAGELPERERKSLRSFKRLVLGLVVFLSADRERVPQRMNPEKLKRLEHEVVQILSVLLRKAAARVLKFPLDTLRALASTLRSACLARKQIQDPGIAREHDQQVERSADLPQEEALSGIWVQELRLKQEQNLEQEEVLGKRLRNEQGEMAGEGLQEEAKESVEFQCWDSTAGSGAQGASALGAGKLSKRVCLGQGLVLSASAKPGNATASLCSKEEPIWAGNFLSVAVKAEPVEASGVDLNLCS